MRIIKIGRSSSNDIVIENMTVSSEHARITITDSGTVYIRDLNSKNGTYVNERRIAEETVITASDVVKVGNSVVDWMRHLSGGSRKPQATTVNWSNNSSSAIKQKKTIGRASSNDIVFNYNDVSGSHAQLIEKINGEIVIADSGSTNGTYVNGVKVSTQALKQGDRVMIANKYRLDWESIFTPVSVVSSNKSEINQSKTKKTGIKTIIISVAAVAALVAVVLFFFYKQREPEIWPPEKVYSTYKKSVVMIYGSYYYEVLIKGEVRRKVVVSENKIEDFDGSNAMQYTGTGFFVSKDGQIVTNRHVVCPWEYDGGTADQIKDFHKRFLSTQSLASPAAFAKYQPLISEVSVRGQLNFIGVILNDSYVRTTDDIIPCTYLKDTESRDIDLGLIQVNSKTLPEGVTTVVSLDNAVISDSTAKIGSKIYTIGFPAGFTVGSTKSGIEANNQSGEITQVRGVYEFGHNISITHGASGSPIFNSYGQLVGVVNAGFEEIHGYNMAVKAKYVKELVK